MHLTTKHLDDEAARIAKLRGDLLIVPPAGSRFIDRPKADLQPIGAAICLVWAAGFVAVLVRFTGVL